MRPLSTALFWNQNDYQRGENQHDVELDCATKEKTQVRVPVLAGHVSLF
jgi:hypothetical protein